MAAAMRFPHVGLALLFVARCTGKPILQCNRKFLTGPERPLIQEDMTMNTAVAMARRFSLADGVVTLIAAAKDAARRYVSYRRTLSQLERLDTDALLDAEERLKRSEDRNAQLLREIAKLRAPVVVSRENAGQPGRQD